MKREQYDAYVKQGCTRIPLVKQELVDMETPLSAYLKLSCGKNAYLFESVQGGEKWGRYSIIGLPCSKLISITANQLTIIENDKVVSTEQVDDPLDWIENYQKQFVTPDIPDLPRFCGGLVGYFGYETIGYIEPKLHKGPQSDKLETPDILLMESNEVVVFDNLNCEIFAIVHANPKQNNAFEKAQDRLDEIVARLHQSFKPPVPQPGEPIKESDFVSEFTEDGFKKGVERIKEYTLAGDIMQVVLSQRMSVPFKTPPINLYRALRYLNPSPYMYFMDMGDFHIVGSSPEILVRLEEDMVTVRPIAGTRRRGRNEHEDKALEKELLADPKEIAEHLMLIDLGRNDAGRVAKTGTVELTDKMIIERYSHVMHIVSNVEAQLKDGLSAIDVLKATFPAGTVSGAPKVRALEIIDELEPVKRGVYSGAVGYIAYSGDMDTAIAIRTAVIKDERLYIQAGAGVVADSIPDLEWKETMNKGRAVFKAANLAQTGLRVGEEEGE